MTVHLDSKSGVLRAKNRGSPKRTGSAAGVKFLTFLPPQEAVFVSHQQRTMIKNEKEQLESIGLEMVRP